MLIIHVQVKLSIDKTLGNSTEKHNFNQLFNLGEK